MRTIVPSVYNSDTMRFSRIRRQTGNDTFATYQQDITEAQRQAIKLINKVMLGQDTSLLDTSGWFTVPRASSWTGRFNVNREGIQNRRINWEQ